VYHISANFKNWKDEEESLEMAWTCTTGTNDFASKTVIGSSLKEQEGPKTNMLVTNLTK